MMKKNMILIFLMILSVSHVFAQEDILFVHIPITLDDLCDGYFVDKINDFEDMKYSMNNLDEYPIIDNNNIIHINNGFSAYALSKGWISYEKFLANRR